MKFLRRSNLRATRVTFGFAPRSTSDRSWWLVVALAAAHALFAVGCAAPAKAPQPCVLVTLTAGPQDLQSAQMGIRFAEKSRESGRRTILYLSSAGAIFAAASVDPALRYLDQPPIGEQIASFAAGGGEVCVAPGCARDCGLSRDALSSFAVPVTPPQLLDRLPRGAVSIAY